MKPITKSGARRFATRSLIAAAALWLGLTGGDSPSATPLSEPAYAGAQTQKRSSAYVYDRAGLKLNDSDAGYLSQLNFSFALLKNGAVSGAHWQSIGAYKAYVAKHSHILPVLSVGGWGADGFSQAAATAEGRARFAKSAVELMEKHGFMGLDVDWEYPGTSAAGIASSPDDRANYTLLLRELRSALDALTETDGKPRLLGIALGADPSLISHLDCAAIGGIVDQVNLMTYDLQAQAVASHHTPLYSADPRYPLSADAAVKAFTRAGIPKEKLMLGVAFYARIYQLSAATDAPVFASARDNGAKTQLYRSFIAETGWSYHFDEDAKAPYAVKGARFATYDDPLSISHKGAYVRDNQLMGLMCWEYGGDRDGELLRAMWESLN